MGRRKEKRPLDFSKPVHLILKASDHGRLLANREVVERTIREGGDRFSVRIYAVGINSDHVHLNLGFEDRSSYNKWVRSVTGVLARRIRGLGWKFIPYTRIETWGRDFKSVQRYVLLNHHEGQLISDGFARVDEFRVRIIREFSAGWRF